jgi:hypothetical protein
MRGAQIEHERKSLQRFMLRMYPVHSIAKRSAFDKDPRQPLLVPLLHNLSLYGRNTPAMSDRGLSAAYKPVLGADFAQASTQ